ncbi:hypothetical protein F5Y16DRAFT_32524 [Xylariaceae sp. FL0255]|nr:hypothetical protein F5Y16DRAFT_32524 [Xylariaceae sp. FL0255]
MVELDTESQDLEGELHSKHHGHSRKSSNGPASNPAELASPNSSSSPSESQQDALRHPSPHAAISFADLPLELREMIWQFALPEPRTFNALVWASSKLKMQLLNRSELKMPLAHVCFEARRVVRSSGYVLAFRDEDEPDDTGVWFHPKLDQIDRTIWGPGDWGGRS